MPGSWQARSSPLATRLPTRICRSRIWSRTTIWPNRSVMPVGHVSCGGWNTTPGCMRSWPSRRRPSGRPRIVPACWPMAPPVQSESASRSRCGRIAARAVGWYSTATTAQFSTSGRRLRRSLPSRQTVPPDRRERAVALRRTLGERRATTFRSPGRGASILGEPRIPRLESGECQNARQNQADAHE